MEYIKDVLSTDIFNNSALQLNPGIPSTFPWLSEIANSFEQYRWRGLVFTYKSTSADLVTGGSGALGSVIMATDYDSLDPLYTTKMEMENAEFTKSAKPSVSFVHPVETARGQTPYKLLYTRENPVPANADRRLYDIGTFQIATTGMPASGNGTAIGELWVSYEIELLKPQFHKHSCDNAIHFQASLFPVDEAITMPNFFADTMVQMPGSNLTGVSIVDGRTIRFRGLDSQEKEYLVIYSLNWATTTGVDPSILSVEFDGLAVPGEQLVVRRKFFGLGGTLSVYYFSSQLLLTSPKALVGVHCIRVPTYTDPALGALCRFTTLNTNVLGDISTLDLHIVEIPSGMTAP